MMLKKIIKLKRREFLSVYEAIPYRKNELLFMYENTISYDESIIIKIGMIDLDKVFER
jgi:hypothetical protein